MKFGKGEIRRDPIPSGASSSPHKGGEGEWVRLAVAASGDLAYRWEIATDRLTWAGGSVEFSGAGEAAVETGHGFNNRIHPEDLPMRLKALSDHFSHGHPYDCEYRVRNAEGGIVWVHDRGRVEHDSKGIPAVMSGTLRAVTQRKQNEAKLERIATYDELTGHFNKTRLREELEQALSFSRRFNVPGAFMVLGIDKLAMVNNAYGYEIGDAVLVAVGQRFDRFLRDSDIIGSASCSPNVRKRWSSPAWTA
jgi:PAS domain S-box-containing protein